MTSSRAEHLTPRWLHRWAVLTVCATFAALLLGSVVTTFKVGMADPVWPTAPWFLFFASWTEPRPGFLIEHGHRLAAYLSGISVIVLALGLWRRDQRLWVRRLGWFALVGVSLQGLLGGLRVRLNELIGTDLALLHGCFAQIVFSALAVLATVTSPRWLASEARETDSRSAQLQRWCVVTAALLYGQIVLGAILRHTGSPLGNRGHLLLAFVAVAAVVWLIKLALDDPERTVLIPAFVLAGLIALQVMQGVEVWLFRFARSVNPDAPIRIPEAALRTGHVLAGFCIFAVAVVAAFRAHRVYAPCVDSSFRARRQAPVDESIQVSPVRLEGSL